MAGCPGSTPGVEDIEPEFDVAGVTLGIGIAGVRPGLGVADVRPGLTPPTPGVMPGHSAPRQPTLGVTLGTYSGINSWQHIGMCTHDA